MENIHYAKIMNSLKNASNSELNINLIFYYIVKATETKSYLFFISMLAYVPLFLILPFTTSIIIMCVCIHLFSWFIQIQYMADEEKVNNEINPIIQALKELKRIKRENKK